MGFLQQNSVDQLRTSLENMEAPIMYLLSNVLAASQGAVLDKILATKLHLSKLIVGVQS